MNKKIVFLALTFVTGITNVSAAGAFRRAAQQGFSYAKRYAKPVIGATAIGGAGVVVCEKKQVPQERLNDKFKQRLDSAHSLFTRRLHDKKIGEQAFFDELALQTLALEYATIRKGLENGTVNYLQAYLLINELTQNARLLEAQTQRFLHGTDLALAQLKAAHRELGDQILSASFVLPEKEYASLADVIRLDSLIDLYNEASQGTGNIVMAIDRLHTAAKELEKRNLIAAFNLSN